MTNIRAFNFSAQKYQWCEVTGVGDTSHQLHVIGQYLNLEKLWQLRDALIAYLSIHDFSLQRTAAGQSVVASVELLEGATVDEVKHAIERIADAFNVDVCMLSSAPSIAHPGLLVMDMDSTVIQVECIDEIAKLAGVGKEVSVVTELAMQGKLDFSESLEKRVGCLKGTSVDVLQHVCDGLPLMPGLENLVSTLKQHDWKVAIASGGFTFFADYLKERLSLDAAFSNELEIVDGKLTGHVLGGIVDAQEKAKVVVSLAEQFNIPMTQTVAMGDGANDLAMMTKAALGVGCHAKPVVRLEADCAIRFGGLDTLLALLKAC